MLKKMILKKGNHNFPRFKPTNLSWRKFLRYIDVTKNDNFFFFFLFFFFTWRKFARTPGRTPAETANVLMRSPSPRPRRAPVPGARSERGRSSDRRGSGPGISCWFRPRSQPPPTSGDNPLEASRDRPCGRTTLPRTSQGTPSAPIPWSRRPRGLQPVSPDGRFHSTPRPRPAPTCRRHSTPAPSPEASALEAPRSTRCSIAADLARSPAGPRGTPPSQSSPRHGRCRRCFGPRKMPRPHPVDTRVPDETQEPGISCPRECCWRRWPRPATRPTPRNRAVRPPRPGSGHGLQRPRLHLVPSREAPVSSSPDARAQPGACRPTPGRPRLLDDNAAGPALQPAAAPVLGYPSPAP